MSALYLPRHFETEDIDMIWELVNGNAFAMLITPTIDPMITHLPLVRIDDGSTHGALIGHVAKPNPQGAQFDGTTPAVAVFSGPHAYVSPTWYVSEDMVPTWNYAAVHIHGAPMAVDDPARADWIIDTLVSCFESDATDNWSVAKMSEKRRLGQMNGIIAFEMPINRIEAKVKMSQNRKPEDIAGVRGALLKSDRQDDRATAELMARLNA